MIVFRTTGRFVLARKDRVLQLQTSKVLPAAILRTISSSVSSSSPTSTATSSATDSNSFKFSQLQIRTCEESAKKPKPDPSQLVFGRLFTDHMLEVHWSLKDGWGPPQISPVHNFSLHPGAKVFHYAIEAFEGMKAFRSVNGKVRLFRPELNVQRFLTSIQRLCLAPFNADEFLTCLKKLVQIESDWVPAAEGTSLYIRPTVIGTQPSLGVAASEEATIFVVLSPVGSYFKTGYKPTALIADPKNVRSWPGGAGSYKVGSNYGPTILLQRQSEDKGYHQILWLFGDDHQLVEVGTMNIFLYLINENGEKELVTPKLSDGLILPGILRRSVLELTREWNEFKVSERVITMKEVLKALSEQRLLEIFGSGTACSICPVGRIGYLGQDYEIPTLNHKEPLNLRLFNAFKQIQYGEDLHPWVVEVC